MLLALVSGQRMQTLCALDLDLAIIDDSKAVFHIQKVLKTTKPGKACTVSLHKFKDARVCPLTCLNIFIEKTRSLRTTSKLFISLQKPHNCVGPQTLSRWVVQVMKEAGLEPGFGAHSTRHASTSSASRTGVSVGVIMDSAGWSNEKTFASFYRKNFKESSNEFAEPVLQGLSST